jgi:hypothetical protein
MVVRFERRHTSAYTVLTAWLLYIQVKSETYTMVTKQVLACKQQARPQSHAKPQALHEGLVPSADTLSMPRNERASLQGSMLPSAS